MPQDIFGNLEDWGKVLDQLDQLASTRRLDEHVGSLGRLLRFRDNWRLREAALQAVTRLEKPAETLTSDVIGIIEDKGLYDDVRILAAEALAHLASLARSQVSARPRAAESTVVERVRALLHSQEAPVFHGALRRLFPTATEPES